MYATADRVVLNAAARNQMRTYRVVLVNRTIVDQEIQFARINAARRSMRLTLLIVHLDLEGRQQLLQTELVVARVENEIVILLLTLHEILLRLAKLDDYEWVANGDLIRKADLLDNQAVFALRLLAAIGQNRIR